MRNTLTAAWRHTSRCPQVSELRGLFDAYLEQMQGMAGSGPEVEALMIRALEAVDMLDGALALHKVGGDVCYQGCVLAWGRGQEGRGVADPRAGRRAGAAQGGGSCALAGGLCLH